MKQQGLKQLPLQNINFFSSRNASLLWVPSRIFPTSWAHYLLDLEKASQWSVCLTFDLKPSAWLFWKQVNTWNQKLTAVSDFLIKSQYQVECTGKFKGLVTCLSQDLLQNGVCHFRNVESSLFKQTFPTSIMTKYWESSRANIFVDIWAERVVET